MKEYIITCLRCEANYTVDEPHDCCPVCLGPIRQPFWKPSAGGEAEEMKPTTPMGKR